MKFSWPDPKKWPWLNPYCRGCRFGKPAANKDAGGQVWQEVVCLHPLVISRAQTFWAESAEVIVEADRECGLYKKKPVRTYKPKPRAMTLTNFKYE